MSKPQGIEKYIREHFAQFAAYSPATSPEALKHETGIDESDIIKLDANENPYGCYQAVNDALAGYRNFNIYPDSHQYELRTALADYCGAPFENIVAGAGSDELIDLLGRVLLEPGDEVITAVPTFDMYRFSTQVCGGKFVAVTREAPEFRVEPEKVKAAITNRTRIIFLANPNNPTGTLIPRDDILELLDIGLPLVIDEAYYEFSGKTIIPLVQNYDNLIVLRTFSKWAGLAGLRVGYGVFPEKLAQLLLTIKQPYNINLAAQVAALESLKYKDYLYDTIDKILTERPRLFQELSRLSFLMPLPSQANFILCKVHKVSARNIHQKLRSRGILVRYYDTPLLQNYVRFSVGKPEQTDLLIQALHIIEEELNG